MMQHELTLPNSSRVTVEPAQERKSERTVALKTPYDGRPTAFGVWLQKTTGWLLLLPFCGLVVLLLRFVGRYRIDRLQEIREAYREICKSDRPLMICANHLTFIDSVLIIWALASNPWYLSHHRKFTWNLPAGDFFKKKLIFRVVAYLSKCLFIHRDGTRAHQTAILDLCRDLLLRGEVVTIFPEGKRSRSGRFELDRLTYGVGKILSQVENPRVLCIYLRGEHQEKHSNFPVRGSRFHFDFQLIEPKTVQKGRQAYSDITHQIAGTIHAMEALYFHRKHRTC